MFVDIAVEPFLALAFALSLFSQVLALLADHLLASYGNITA